MKYLLVDDNIKQMQEIKTITHFHCRLPTTYAYILEYLPNMMHTNISRRIVVPY